MKVYVMRHGTTVWNEKGITQGRTNNRLSSSGKSLTEQVSLKYKNIPFDVIFTSPLMRTMQTSNIMNKYHNVKIVKDEKLIEIDQGIFSGKSKNDLTEEEIKIKNSRKGKGMESYQSVLKRVKDFLKEIKSNKQYQNVLIITHNVNASFIADILNNIEIDFKNPNHLRNFNNAEIKCFTI